MNMKTFSAETQCCTDKMYAKCRFGKNCTDKKLQCIDRSGGPTCSEPRKTPFVVASGIILTVTAAQFIS